MKIVPMNVPAPAATQQQSQGQSAREKAMAAFMGQNQATAPASSQPAAQVVQNQSSIAPEEMGAIRSTSGQSDSNSEATQEDTAESTLQAPPQAEKSPEEQALSRQFAQLARQEKALRAKAQQQEQALRDREAKLAAREAELTGKPQTDMSKYVNKDQFKADPLTALAEAGVSYEELTQMIINQQPVDPRLQNTISRLETRNKELEDKINNIVKGQEDQQTQAYQAAVKQIKTDVTKLVNSDPNFETIKATSSVSDVVELIEKTYKEDGILLSVEEAAQQVEDYLMEESLKLTRIEKIKRKLAEQSTSTPTSSKAQTQPNTQQQPQQMKTLTNAASTQRQLSAKERAILAFKGELKS